MNFGQLKTNVQSGMGRDDVPDYVYELATAAINRDMRILGMETQVVLTTTATLVALPSDFQEVQSIYMDYANDRVPLLAITDQATSIYSGSGAPKYYSIQGTNLNLSPEPDGSYDVYVNYFAKFADLSGDSDENEVLTRYPDVYLYSSLTHAAIWAVDNERAQAYGAAYMAALKAAKKDDHERRFGTSLTSRNARL